MPFVLALSMKIGICAVMMSLLCVHANPCPPKCAFAANSINSDLFNGIGRLAPPIHNVHSVGFEGHHRRRNLKIFMQRANQQNNPYDSKSPSQRPRAFVTRSYLDLVLSDTKPVAPTKTKELSKRQRLKHALDSLWNSLRSFFSNRQQAPINNQNLPPMSSTRRYQQSTYDKQEMPTTGRLQNLPTNVPFPSSSSLSAPANRPPAISFDESVRPVASVDSEEDRATAAAAESARLEQLMEGYIRRHNGQPGAPPARPTRSDGESSALAWRCSLLPQGGTDPSHI
jgi:hypothetical protein